MKLMRQDDSQARSERELERLRRLAQECGAKAGLEGLRLPLEPLVESELRSLAARLFGPPEADQAILLEQIDLTRGLQREDREKVQQYQAARHDNPSRPILSEHARIARWRPAVSVAVAFALFGLPLRATGITGSRSALVILLISACLAILYASALRVLFRATTARLRDFFDYRHALRSLRKRDRQIEIINERILPHRESRNEREQWVAFHKAAVLSQYELSRTIAEHAAHVAAADGTKFLPEDLIQTRQ